MIESYVILKYLFDLAKYFNNNNTNESQLYYICFLNNINHIKMNYSINNLNVTQLLSQSLN